MERILDIVTNTMIFIFIGYVFYAVYKMHQQDKEFAKHEKNS